MKVDDFAQPEGVIYFNPRAGSKSALAVVTDTNAADLQWNRYCAAFRRWKATKSEVDRRAAREAYEAFGVPFSGDAAFIMAEAARVFGGVT